jgi:hypothetical protein
MLGSPLRKGKWGNLRKAAIVAYFEALLFAAETRCNEEDRWTSVRSDESK